ncbi:hypothetical protein CIHG_04642 [Coccidioides immitis H538.4]|uniref:Uncharacterized protein n=2 Tax=Coccidioides immitis TaxID=5501 RepID=A0A0J8UHE6_COCIT|nr:hypothetical protein CIRG_06809 [Coccidioides immitis RMSCC 2394]KMU86853.1 hypothetical protein CIHG_04642 [Coccidioides immitis H538.4]
MYIVSSSFDSFFAGVHSLFYGLPVSNRRIFSFPPQSAASDHVGNWYEDLLDHPECRGNPSPNFLFVTFLFGTASHKKLVNIENIDLKCIHNLTNKKSDVDGDNENDRDNRDDGVDGDDRDNGDDGKSNSYILENTECEKARK